MVIHDHENTRDSLATMAGPVLALSHHGKCTFNGLVLWGKHGDPAGSLVTCRTAVSCARTPVLSQTPPVPCITAYRTHDTIAFTAIRNLQAASVGSESIDTCVCFTWYD